MAIPYGIGVQWNHDVLRNPVPSGTARNKVTHNSVAIKCTVVASRWAHLVGNSHPYSLLHCDPRRNRLQRMGVSPNVQRASLASPSVTQIVPLPVAAIPNKRKTSVVDWSVKHSLVVLGGLSAIRTFLLKAGVGECIIWPHSSLDTDEHWDSLTRFPIHFHTLQFTVRQISSKLLILNMLNGAQRGT